MQNKEKNIQNLANTFILTKNDRSFRNLFDRLKPGIFNHCYKITKVGI